jgi:NADH-quinone oxidoreductase subunit N
MELMVIIALLLITLGSALSFRVRWITLPISVIALIMVSQISGGKFLEYTGFVVVIAILNLLSLGIMKKSQIKGVDFGLVALIGSATIYIVFTKDLAMILTTFVVVSVPTYMLVFVNDDIPNVKIGIKYVTFMVLATILFVIGALILSYNHNNFNGTVYILGYTLLIVGLALEVGAAPLHIWAPDVFSNADPIPVSIIASIAKIVPVVVALKILIATTSPLTASASMIAVGIGLISMFTGNIGALTSRELGRVLAYSSTANMGYIISAFVVLINPAFLPLAVAGILLQLIVNAAGKIGMFSAIKEGGGATHLMYLLALSFIGLPPLMGFWSKLFIAVSLINVGYTWLALLLVLNSTISVPYYLRVARDLSGNWVLSLGTIIGVVAALIMLVTLLPPSWFVSGVEKMMEFMTFNLGGM